MHKQIIQKGLKSLRYDDAEFIIVISNIYNAFPHWNHNACILATGELFSQLRNTLLPHQTLLFPAFSYSFATSGVFDILLTRPETGALPKMAFRTREFARTSSPMTSYFVWPSTSNMSLRKETTTFGEESVFGSIKDRKSKVLCFGQIDASEQGWIAVHHAEELEKVPYRYFKEFSGTLCRDNVEITACSQKHYCRNHEIGVVNDYRLLNHHLEENGMIARGEQDEFVCSACWSDDIISVAVDLIRADEYSLTNIKTVLCK